MLNSGIAFNQDGLVCVVVQSTTGRVLMVAWMNEEALKLTVEKGIMTFWSRSRQEIWVKGATSGNTQRLLKLELDCDGDALLATVEESGPACHNGTDSCFDSQVIFDGEEA
jgi:phosphoribosyl-AMP cyclohydrolase